MLSWKGFRFSKLLSSIYWDDCHNLCLVLWIWCITLIGSWMLNQSYITVINSTWSVSDLLIWDGIKVANDLSRIFLVYNGYHCEFFFLMMSLVLVLGWYWLYSMSGEVCSSVVCFGRVCEESALILWMFCRIHSEPLWAWDFLC